MPIPLTFTSQLTWPPQTSSTVSGGPVDASETNAPLHFVHGAALLAVLAVIVFVIVARYQRKWIKAKTKIELFDRRFLIYSAATEVITAIKNQGGVDEDTLSTLQVRSRDARWLLSEEIAVYLQQIHGNAIKLQNLLHTLATIPPGAPCSEYMERQVQLRYWFAVQTNILDRRLAPFLVVDQAQVAQRQAEPAFL